MAATIQLMDAAAYDAWYHTPRGRWIGDTEFRLLARLLQRHPDESLLDIGCGTGYFTRRFAQESASSVNGLDPDLSRLRFASNNSTGNECYVAGNGSKLPFPDRSFDCTISVTALCFAENQASFLSEMVRVTKRRFVLGLLNRNSLLYCGKGRQGGTGAYQGARWHTAHEISDLLTLLPVNHITIRNGIFCPDGGKMGQWLERIVPDRMPLGAFLAVAGDRR